MFVCKYVGTPDTNERLQTGQNPISVSVSALKNFTGIGSFFNDKQGRSYAIAFDIGQAEPDVSQCPPVAALTPVTPQKPAVGPATCDADGVLELPTTPGVNYLVDPPFNGAGQYTITATAKAGYVLVGKTVFHVTVPKQLTAKQCAASKVTICHRTNSNKNPYVRITPSAAGVHNGHDKKHEGPVYNPTLKAQHIKWGDIIPPYTYKGVNYPGQNFGAAGRAIYNNGCKPVPVPNPPKPPVRDTEPEGLLPDTGGTPLWMLLMGGALTAGGVVLLRGARRPAGITGSWGGGDASLSLALPPKLMAAPVRAVVSSQAKSEWLMLAGGVVAAAVAAFFFGSRLR